MTGIESTHAFRRTVLADAPRIRRAERVMPLALLFGVIGAVFAAIAVLMILTIDQTETSSERAEQFWVSLLAIVGAVFFFASIAYSVWALNRKWRRRRAAAELAIARGWHYNFAWDPADFPATLFRIGRQSWAENVSHLHEPRYIEVGNFSYTTTEGARARREIGFVAIMLDRTLPHMYLASTDRAGTRPYAPPFRSDQRLSLEGDFDRWFRLYCPREYERDALYIITPDVMALMIDEAPGFDIEIIDDRMFLIARHPFDMSDGRVFDFAQRVAATLGRKTAGQSVRYRDERSDDAAFIDEPGSRLRTGRWALTVGPAVIVGLVWIGIAWASGIITS